MLEAHDTEASLRAVVPRLGDLREDEDRGEAGGVHCPDEDKDDDCVARCPGEKSLVVTPLFACLL